MYRNILVPTDGSLVSARAEKVAVEMARRFGARITVAHVVVPWAPDLPGQVPDDAPSAKLAYERLAQQRGKAAARRVLACAKRAHVPAASVLDVDDSPGEALMRIARDNACDLIVMASSSRAGIERIFLGSVASEIANGTKTPVLICH